MAPMPVRDYVRAMWILAFALAAAAAPAVFTDAAGVVRATVTVPAPPEQALALVRDPLATHRLGGGEGQLTATPASGCLDLGYRLDNPIATVAYTAKACPTPGGLRTDLVRSDSFRALKSEWVVRAVPGGSELTYTYSADLNVPAPDWMIRRRTESSITAMMTAVAAKLGG